jgi:3-deoxy-D-manno-octulosonic-acid transferase
MLLIYSIALKFYYAAIFIASFFNDKAKQWITGRQNLFKRLQNELKPDEKRIWFHCSSFGEFEQGRPVLQALKKN